MEPYITLSHLNDFIFCPRSIYYHQLYATFNEANYKQKPQILGTAAHEAVDAKRYSTKASVLMGVEVFCAQYNIAGKIDVFDTSNGVLTERKRSIKTIYDGYVFQVYAQYFALEEMGYKVLKIIIHDLVHNKNYAIPIPNKDAAMLEKFEELINDIQNYTMDDACFIPNVNKCNNCIYNQLCDKSLC